MHLTKKDHGSGLGKNLHESLFFSGENRSRDRDSQKEIIPSRSQHPDQGSRRETKISIFFPGSHPNLGPALLSLFGPLNIAGDWRGEERNFGITSQKIGIKSDEDGERRGFVDVSTRTRKDLNNSSTLSLSAVHLTILDSFLSNSQRVVAQI